MADDILRQLLEEKERANGGVSGGAEDMTSESRAGLQSHVDELLQQRQPRPRKFSTRPYLLQPERTNVQLLLWGCQLQRRRFVPGVPPLPQFVFQEIASLVASFDTTHLEQLTSNVPVVKRNHGRKTALLEAGRLSERTAQGAGNTWLDSSWRALQSWGDFGTPYRWSGIFWDERDRVQEVALPAMQLCGRIPVALTNFHCMTTLNLGDFRGGNQLTGSIPTEIGRLINLEALLLYDNDFRGRIPSELGKLVKLRNLSLHVNKLSGQIPKEIGFLTSLTKLYLWGNCLGGKLPPGLRNMRKLKQLWLHGLRNNFKFPPGFNSSDHNNLQVTGSKNVRRFLAAVFPSPVVRNQSRQQPAATDSDATSETVSDAVGASLSSEGGTTTRSSSGIDLSALAHLETSLGLGKSKDDAPEAERAAVSPSSLPGRKRTLLDLAAAIVAGENPLNESKLSPSPSAHGDVDGAEASAGHRGETKTGGVEFEQHVKLSPSRVRLSDSGQGGALADFLQRQKSGTGPKISLAEFLRQQEARRAALQSEGTNTLPADSPHEHRGPAVRMVKTLKQRREQSQSPIDQHGTPVTIRSGVSRSTTPVPNS